MSKSVHKPRRRVVSPPAARRSASAPSLWLALACTPAYHASPIGVGGRDSESTEW